MYRVFMPIFLLASQLWAHDAIPLILASQVNPSSLEVVEYPDRLVVHLNGTPIATELLSQNKCKKLHRCETSRAASLRTSINYARTYHHAISVGIEQTLSSYWREEPSTRIYVDMGATVTRSRYVQTAAVKQDPETFELGTSSVWKLGLESGRALIQIAKKEKRTISVLVAHAPGNESWEKSQTHMFVTLDGPEPKEMVPGVCESLIPIFSTRGETGEMPWTD